MSNFAMVIVLFLNTRSYAALWAADLDWIVAPGYSLVGYILEKNHEKPWKPTWNHENQSGTMKNQLETIKQPWKPTWNRENQPGTM